MTMAPEDRIIVALDRATDEENIALIRELKGRARWFKVGMRQFYAGADRVFDAIRDAEAQLFLDLKLHDIPETVAGASASLAPIAPELLTIHASGGAAMVKAAVDTLASSSPKTKVLSVTILTSMGPEDIEVFGSQDVSSLVVGLATRAVRAGSHGVVASAQEAALLRPELGDALIVTPGIRPAGSAVGDQKRVMGPKQAIEVGADLLVIGRPINAVPEPKKAFDAIVEELA